MERRSLAVSDLFTGQDGLSTTGEWLEVQLRIIKAWAGRKGSDEQSASSEESIGSVALPQRWELTRGLGLFEWQRSCAQRWLDGGRRGIAKVVTGAGKTIFAQHLIERLQTEVDSELRVAVVVPTIVLMRQWMESLRANSNLPAGCIGGLGGGKNDSFSETVRILVCVINSASKLLPQRVDTAKVGEHLLLVVDECHRASGASMSRIFKSRRKFSLGLSATPEQETSEKTASGDQLAGPAVKDITGELGPVFYELGPAEAIDQGILSTFEFRHYGLSLEGKERASYDKISREIRELTRKLRGAMSTRRGGSAGSLSEFARRCSSRPGSPFFEDASQYLSNVRRRKQLLYRARARGDAVLELVRRTLSEKPGARILVFHESIDEVMRLYAALLQAGCAVTTDHSKLPDSVRADSIGLFRRGAANVLISARTLIEGFDVPSADVGIIAASSASPRQRIQTIGRLLRRPRDGSAKRAVIHTLYMARTIDEAIYEKLDWRTVTGAEEDLYFSWSPPPPEVEASDREAAAYQPQPQSAPPRRPRPGELGVDWHSLKPGDIYPGSFEGTEYRCDGQGNVVLADGTMATNPQDVPGMISKIVGAPDKFRVTPVKRAILVWDRAAGAPRFVGMLPEPFIHEPQGPGQYEEFRLVQWRGERRIRNQAGSIATGPDASSVIDAVLMLERRLAQRVKTVRVSGRQVFCWIGGERHALCELEKGLTFK